jgi:uncharacterized DUF497 family protein
MLLFEWDIEKAKSNEKKHGILFKEASTDKKNATRMHPILEKGTYFFHLLHRR